VKLLFWLKQIELLFRNPIVFGLVWFDVFLFFDKVLRLITLSTSANRRSWSFSPQYHVSLLRTKISLASHRFVLCLIVVVDDSNRVKVVYHTITRPIQK